ncbi:hypothetical protein [Nocardiopsis coralliicola]
MGDVLSALIPPAVVAAVFCTFVVKLLRHEMAPRTSDGRRVSEAREDAAEADANGSGGEKGSGAADTVGSAPRGGDDDGN